MADPHVSSPPPARSSNELAEDRTGFAHERTDLAVDRTLLAHERTLMAWTRTAMSMISFGFSIYTFFDRFGNKEESRRLFGPANYALIMIVSGLISLILATLRHWSDVRQIRTDYNAKPSHLAVILACFVSILGILGFVAVVFRL